MGVERDTIMIVYLTIERESTVKTVENTLESMISAMYVDMTRDINEVYLVRGS